MLRRRSHHGRPASARAPRSGTGDGGELGAGEGRHGGGTRRPAGTFSSTRIKQPVRGLGPAGRRLWAWFEADMAPGYAWSFPLPNGTANVGYGVLRRAGQQLGDLRGQRVDLLARPHIAEVLGADAAPLGPWKAWPIPAGISHTPLSGLGGRVLFAGDAARACDPMT